MAQKKKGSFSMRTLCVPRLNSKTLEVQRPPGRASISSLPPDIVQYSMAFVAISTHAHLACVVPAAPCFPPLGGAGRLAGLRTAASLTGLAAYLILGQQLLEL